jgi:hypothetical protein
MKVNKYNDDDDDDDNNNNNNNNTNNPVQTTICIYCSTYSCKYSVQPYNFLQTMTCNRSTK